MNAKCFKVSPIHWQATHQDVMITRAGAALHLTESDSKKILQALCSHFRTENLTFSYQAPTSWSLQVTPYVPIAAKPVDEMLNQPLRQVLLHLDPTLFWQKFFTESQMLLASLSHPSGINGVWVWQEKSWLSRLWRRMHAD